MIGIGRRGYEWIGMDWSGKAWMEWIGMARIIGMTRSGIGMVYEWIGLDRNE